MSDVSWLWLAAVGTLFAMACAIAWRDNVGTRLRVWAQRRIVNALDNACAYTGHRWCYYLARWGITLADRWHLDIGDDHA